MKRILAFILVSVMLLTVLASCGEKENQTTGTTSGSTSSSNNMNNTNSSDNNEEENGQNDQETVEAAEITLNEKVLTLLVGDKKRLLLQYCPTTQAIKQ